ncbi:MAG: rhamnogalacturonan lyase B N-terminal domain-containing protein [Luteolibacter sp.]
MLDDHRKPAKNLIALAAAAFLLANQSAVAAFGLTTTTSLYTVDTGAGLVFTVNRTNGNVASIQYNGTELNSSTASHINSGIGSTGTTVTASATSSTILITVSTDSTNTVIPSSKHYYAVKTGVNNIYMATYLGAATGNGELRWITRLKSSVLTSFPAESDNTGTTYNVESSDIKGYADGHTTSKYYGNQQAKDLTVRGDTGSSIGVFMAYGNRESSSGGPFFRDIQNQSSLDSTDGGAEIYNYLFSGHQQTESARIGVLHGPYALVFTSGSTPSVPDMSFLSSLDLTGYVASADRGRVILNGLKGRDTAYTYTVGFANTTAQYWTTASASSGSAGCYNMKPGTYTMTVYKGELAVYTESVTVTAGSATTLNTRTITADPSSVTAIWRIGDWDGTPNELLNGQTFAVRHPSDTRNSSWVPGSYAAGSANNTFPAAIWQDTNNAQVVTFSLTDAQVAAHTVRIGITAAYGSGRPKIQINSWTSSIPSASTQPSSRSLTIGTYRGNNTTYTYSVPASALVSGTNTMTITISSGSSGSGYLSPCCGIDCLDFY